jgi:hypothetical protein
MAFSKTPQTSTYQTKEISLLNEWGTRDASSTKDNDALNCFYDIVQNKKTGDKDHWVVKRDGTVAYPFVSPSGTIRGLHYWEDQDKLFIATSDDISIVTASTGTLVTTLSAAFGTTTGDVGFCEFLFDTNNTKVCATDGTTLITIDSSNTKVVVVDADLPAPHIPQPVFLDGYLFLVKSGTADIYNSDLNDPTSWTPGDFLTAEMTADKIMAVANINNYLIIFGSGSIEYFFDAANASGSPLQKYDAPHKFIGYLGGLAKYENELIFIGSSLTGGPQIYMAKDAKVEPISTPPMRRAIEAYTTYKASVVSYGGHDFYHLNVGSLSYQFDLETKLWTRTAFKATAYMAITYAVSVKITGVGTQTVFALDGSTTMYYFKPSSYRDDATNFTVQIITDSQMFDTYREKTCARMILVGDRSTSSATADVSWSDDDYQTYSTARTVDMNLDLPVLHRLGQFRRRAFKVGWTQNLPMRFKHIELDLNMGQS